MGAKRVQDPAVRGPELSACSPPHQSAPEMHMGHRPGDRATHGACPSPPPSLTGKGPIQTCRTSEERPP